MKPFPLLKTKIEIPVTRSKLVSRSHLLEKIQECVRSKLTLVCAPAGYGKTTCLRQWARKCKYGVAWFSIDPSDNDPTHFWTYFITALKTLGNPFGQNALNMLHSSRQPHLETVLTVYLNEIIKLENQVVIILDDYHHITNPSIHSSITYFLEHLSQNLKLIISSRSSPEIQVSRLRAQGQLSEIRSSDLRFTPAETALFLNDFMGLGLPAEYVAKLEDRTEGWITGLQLAALTLQGHEDIQEFIDSFSGSHHYIAHYLVEEIFNKQFETVKSFLLQTSILDRLYGPLCDFITGRNDSATIIELLENDNLFIFPLDDERLWYRYHGFFHEILLNRLKRSLPDKISELHHHASLWFEHNGYPNDAIQHAIEGSDYDRAADLIEKHVLDTFNRGETKTVMNWLNTLPENLIRSRPGICVAHAYAIFFNPTVGSNEIIEKRLHDAERIIHSSSDRYEQSYIKYISGYIAGIRAHLARERGDSPQKIIDLSRKALKNIRENDPISCATITMNLAMAYRAIGDAPAAISALEESVQISEGYRLALSAVYSTYLLAQIAYIQGHLQESALICREAQRQYERNHVSSTQLLPVFGALDLCLGMVLLEKNSLDAAEKTLLKGFEHLKIMRDLDSLLAVYAALVRLRIAQNADFFQVMNLIDEMEQLGREAIQFGTALRISLLLSRAKKRPDHQSAAALLAQRHGLNLQGDDQPPGIDHIGQRHHEVQLAFVRLLISQRSIFPKAKGQPELDTVLLFLEKRLNLAEKRGLTTWIIQLLILKALARQARSEMNEALSNLEQAFYLARPEGFIRIFADEGEPMADLLRKAISWGIHHEYASLLLDATNIGLKDNKKHDQQEAPSSLFEPISERELQILRLVAAGLSNREIADELFLAEGTVKAHIHNIYGKLNVNKRTQAVSRARELSLL